MPSGHLPDGSGADVLAHLTDADTARIGGERAADVLHGESQFVPRTGCLSKVSGGEILELLDAKFRRALEVEVSILGDVHPP